MNLRGQIVPIIDLRMKLGIADPRYDRFTVVVILEIGTAAIGIVVDSVADVTSLTDAQCKPAPNCPTEGERYVSALATMDERLLILVDIARMLACDLPANHEQLAA